MKTKVKYGLLFFLLLGNQLFGQLSPGPLSQAHAQLEGTANCTACHSLGEQVPNKKCLDCHNEISSLLNQNRGYHASREVKPKLCIDCHSEHHGRKFEMIRFDEQAFDHNLSGYELKGAHNRIGCLECHQPQYIKDRELKNRKGTFLGLGKECLNCHLDYHQETLTNKCLECHNFEDWRPAPGFDHDAANFKLVGAHKEVDCIECHKKTTRNSREFQEFTGLEFNQCISCHKDVHEGRFGRDCLKCHNQNSFRIGGNLSSFNHDITDFPLKGMHAHVDCRECHKNKSYTQPLPHNQCKSCHTDYHKGEFQVNGQSPDCNQCHTVDEPFTFTLYGLDDHQASDFPLEGAHIATPCFACHLKENQERWAFDKIGNNCVDCHKNIHANYIDSTYLPDNKCTICHSQEAWSLVSFDHGKTGWELEGGHSNITCRSCHFREVEESHELIQKFRDLSTDCIACHQNVHGSQFEEEGKLDCKRCHTVSNEWNADNFDHAKTQFPLEGQHEKLNCMECHKPNSGGNGEIIQYKIKKFTCIDCHSS